MRARALRMGSERQNLEKLRGMYYMIAEASFDLAVLAIVQSPFVCFCPCMRSFIWPPNSVLQCRSETRRLQYSEEQRHEEKEKEKNLRIRKRKRKNWQNSNKLV